MSRKVRVFADWGDVPEDSTTGFSNRCLAAYLVQYDYFDSDEIGITSVAEIVVFGEIVERYEYDE